MPLPILNSPVESDLLRLFHRMTLHWSQHLGETAQLEVGTAIANTKLNQVFDANVILDAALPEGVSPAQAVAMVDAHFAAIGGACRKWIMNPSAAPETTRPLVDHLLAGTAEVEACDVMYLVGRPLGAIAGVAGLKIIPARASYKHARQLAEQAAARWNCPQLVDAHLLHLDDPHWDSLLALKDGQAVAHVGVLSAGDAGMIEEVFVAPEYRRQGIARVMIDRALEICARSLFKYVMLGVLPDNAPAQSLYATMGFRKIGQIVSYFPGGRPGERS